MRLTFFIGLIWGLVPVVLGRHWLGLDLLRMDMGSMCEWRNLVFSGQPLWISPHLGLGAPFAADPLQGVFYPLKWLYFWLPGYLATDAHVTLHFAIAAAGATLLARTFRLGRSAALLLGVAYLFSGTMVDLAKHSPYLIGGAWLPWAWALARLNLRRATPWRAIGLVLSLGMMLLGGDAFTWLWGFAVTSLEALAAVIASSAKRKLPALRTVGLAVLGGAVGMVVWWPAWLELASTGRQDGISLESALRWSWNPSDWPGVLLPGIFIRGTLLGGSLWSFLNQVQGSFPWNESPTLGFFAVFGALAGVGSAIVARVSKRKGLPALGILPWVFVLSLVLVVGSHLPAAGWLYRAFPFLTNLRYPSKHWVMVNLAAVMMAGLMMAGVNLRLNRRMLLGLTTLGALVGVALLAASPWLLEASRNLALSQGWQWTDQAPTAAGVLAIAMVPFAIALAAGWLIVGNRRWTRPELALVPLVMEVGLGVGSNVEWMPREQATMELFSPLKVVAEEHRSSPASVGEAVFCLSNPIEQQGFTQKSLDGAEDLSSLMVYQRLVALPQLNACDGVTIAHGYSVMRQEILRKLQIKLEELPSAARALGCTHLVSLVRGELPMGAQELIPGAPEGQGGRLVVGRVSEPIPDFFVTRRIHSIGLDWDYVGLSRAEMKPLDLLSHVAGPFNVDEPSVQAEEKVEGQKINASHYRIRLPGMPRGSGPRLVGVKTSYARGWRATQAGKALPTVAAGGLFLAAVVEDPSLGEVEFNYSWPLGWR